MLNSVRNSESGNLSLLEEMHCDKFFCTSEFVSQISKMKKHRPDLAVITVPLFEEIIASPVEHFPFEKTWETAQDEPILVCHTSGSTGTIPPSNSSSSSAVLFLTSLFSGNPKPIPLTHAYYGLYEAQAKIPTYKGRMHMDYSMFDFHFGGRFHSTFPPYHVSLSSQAVQCFFSHCLRRPLELERCYPCRFFAMPLWCWGHLRSLRVVN